MATLAKMLRKPTIRLPRAWAAMLMLAASSAPASPACPNGALSVAFFEFGSAYRDGQGYDVDIIRELAKRLNCPIQSETLYPRIRALRMLEIGQADIGTATLITAERQRYLWLFPYYHSKNLVLLHKSADTDSLEALLAKPDIHWGMVRGYRHSPAQDKLLETLNRAHKLIVASDEDDLYKMLSSGVVQAGFGHPISYDPWLSRHHAGEQIIARDFFPNVETVAGGIALSRKRFSQEAAELWHQEIIKMHRDGTLKTLMRKYLSAPSVEHLLKRPLE